MNFDKNVIHLLPTKVQFSQESFKQNLAVAVS